MLDSKVRDLSAANREQRVIVICASLFLPFADAEVAGVICFAF